MRIVTLASGIVLSALVLAGCATPARVGQMTVDVSPQYRTQPTPLRNNLAIKEVTGGGETNPLWASKVSSSAFEDALEESLKGAGLLADRQTGDFVLTADLAKLDQPIIGIAMTVTSSVRYLVVERASGRTVLDETLTTPYTAKFTDSLLATERLKLANEGSIRANISELLSKLLNLRIGGIIVEK